MSEGAFFQRRFNRLGDFLSAKVPIYWGSQEEGAKEDEGAPNYEDKTLSADRRKLPSWRRHKQVSFTRRFLVWLSIFQE